jgi:hypothetical protein
MRHAQAFVDEKGRLPESKYEFFNWLVEYDVLIGDALCRALEVYEAHLKLCNSIKLHTPVQMGGDKP